MPLIAPQRKPDRQPLSAKVDARLLTVLKAYASFIESGLEYVVNQALLVTFSADRDFQTWLADHHPEEWQAFRDLRDEQRSPSSLHRRPPAASVSPSPSAPRS